MCGIYGAISSAAAQKVLAGLKRLEYRGYDSWGIASLDKKICLEKHVGKIGLVKKISLPNNSLAIGHTRWATHGGVTANNAHPHLASDGSFALAQNGVVENFAELKKFLVSKNYKFKSDTDTEVIVGLVEKFGFKKAFKKLAGRNTIIALFNTGDIIAARQGSPLFVGRDGRGNIYFSSDLPSLSVDASEYYQLANGEIVSSKNLPKKNWQAIKIVAQDLSLGKHAHYMHKEIYEQKQTLLNCFLANQDKFAPSLSAIKKAKNIYVLGAGSASFAALYISLRLRQLQLNVYAIPSYEADSFKSLVSKEDLCIVLSQSGETADSNEVVEWMKAKGVKIMSVINMPGSSLEQMSDYVHPLAVGPEIGVASTKALTAHLAWGWMISQLLAGQKISEVKKQLLNFSKKIGSWLEHKKLHPEILQISKFLQTQPHIFVLGRGELYPAALEFALKIKEISYLHAEGFSGGELKHGMIALIRKNSPVVCLINKETEVDMLSAAHEVKARGAKVIGIASKNNLVFDYFLPIVKDEEWSAIAAIIPAQLLAYDLALKMGYDPDKPRNLAKSVTVK